MKTNNKKKDSKIKIRPNEKTISIDLVAFLFDSNKKLIEKADVVKNEVSFKTSIDDNKKFNLLLAPKREITSREENYKTLVSKYKAYQPKIYTNNKNELEVLSIPDRFTNFWFLRKCRVLGNVSKRFSINNFSEIKGLCNMRVHICEVDRIQWLIPKIPDDIIVRIPDLVLYPEIPIPIPTLPEIPEPIPTIPSSDIKLKTNFFEGEVRPILSSNLLVENSTELSRYRESILTNQNIVSALKTKNPQLIRNIITENFSVFHPVLCYVPWLWPYFYKCDKLKTVYTDVNGDFDTEIYYSIFGDHPDLYFWVEAFIDGQWETVYKPWIPCNTYWDYSCGTEVNITITDSRVRWECSNDIDGELIWIKTVNWGTSVSHIEQRNVHGTPIQGQLLNRQGLTDKHETEGNFRRPFAKNLSFMLQFSKDLPSSTYSYYRWSYRKLKNADLSDYAGTTESLNNLVQKSYSYTYQDVDGHFHFNYNRVKLGPFDVGSERDLYLIPTSSPKDAPFNVLERDADWDRNTRTIGFDSSLEGDGLYEFILELFDKDGNKITNIPNELFQVPDYNTFVPSINAPRVNLISSGVNTCRAFKMVMRIDNRKTQADIYKVKVDGVEVNPTCCGFVPYQSMNSDIEIKFRAYHPHNFADLSFVVQKGNCNDPIQRGKTNTRGMVIGSTYQGGLVHYVRNGFSEYIKTFKPADLLGTCIDEKKAAFAQRLYVNALATNGNDEVDEYDSSKLVAFALDMQE